jgi:hypothetical protein
MRAIAALLAGVVLAGPVRAADAPDPAVKVAIEKALKRIEAGVTNYPKQRRCFSCHHQAMAILSLSAARERGFPVEAEFVQRQVAFSLQSFRNRAVIAKGQGVGGDSTAVVYALHAFAAGGHPYDETTTALVEYLLVKQRRDGAWPIPAFGDRPPTMGSLFTNTGLALFALKRYRPPPEVPDAAELHKRIDAAFARGRAWLLANTPVTTEDKVFRLKGLVYASADPAEVARARDRLLKDQRPDGSWAQLADMPGDAYATATALVALREAGLDTRHPAYQKGVAYLLTTQRDDGAWLVTTRSRPLQPFFDNGDPGGKSQFISFAATNWAALALLETIPPRPSATPSPPAIGAAGRALPR